MNLWSRRQARQAPSRCFCKLCQQKHLLQSLNLFKRSLHSARTVEEQATGLQPVDKVDVPKNSAIGVKEEDIKSRTAEPSSNHPETTLQYSATTTTTTTTSITPTDKGISRDHNQTLVGASTVANKAMCRLNVSNLAMIQMP